MYSEILIYWVLLAYFSFKLTLIRQCFFLFLLFSCFIFYVFKPNCSIKTFSRVYESSKILLNIYVFNLINFTKLCSLLATFVNTQETFQGDINFAVRVIRRRDVGQCQINVETKLCITTLKFTMLNNVKATLSISTLILTKLDNVKTMLLFSTSNFIRLINAETTLLIWIFLNIWKEQINIFELQKKGDSFD